MLRKSMEVRAVVKLAFATALHERGSHGIRITTCTIGRKPPGTGRSLRVDSAGKCALTRTVFS